VTGLVTEEAEGEDGALAGTDGEAD
jgi:hypothetical protein